MERRSFLSTIVCLLFVRGVSAQEVNKTDPKNWKVGTNLDILTPDEEIKAFAEAGFSCCEVRSTVDAAKTDEQLIEEFKRFKSACDRYGVEIWSLHMRYGTNPDPSSLDEKIQSETIADALRFFELNQYLGAKVFVIHPCWPPNPEETREERIEQAVATYNFLREKAAEKGIQLAAENLPYKWAFFVADSGEMNEFLRRVGPQGVWCFDCGHALEETPDHFLDVMDRPMMTVHMHDNDHKEDRHWLPYDGVIDWRALMNVLIKRGYTGPFIFESTSRAATGKEATFAEIAEVWRRLQNDHD